MKKVIVAGGILTAVLGAAVGLFAFRASAQERGRAIVSAPFLPLEGLGSSIGVSVRDTDADESRRAGTNGVVVLDVREGTPAGRAGLRKGDVIVEFDGERARSARQLTRLVRETAPGRAVKVTVVRDSSRQSIDITPEARGSAALQLPDVVTNIRPRLRGIQPNFSFDFLTPDGLLSPRRLGVTVTPLSDQLATFFGVKAGALVSEVAAGSPAEAVGIKAGDVITSINGHAVSSTNDVAREVRAAGVGSVEIRVTRDRREMTMTPKLSDPSRPPAVVGGRPI